MKHKSEQEILAVAAATAERVGVEIVEVVFKEEPAELTVFIDREGGVDLDTCEVFHNAFGEDIDELDPTFGSPYTLNVSSPGLDRPFKTRRDFERALGQDVEVKLYSPLKGKKYFEGNLKGFDDGSVTLDIGGKELKIERTRIAKINKAIKFE